MAKTKIDKRKDDLTMQCLHNHFHSVETILDSCAPFRVFKKQ